MSELVNVTERELVHKVQIRPDVRTRRWSWNCLTCKSASEESDWTMAAARHAACAHHANVDLLP